ncbi:MAG: hypothetical protein JO347_04930 [Candidatus Eremiobacteraeota bacterium]|nr:hypothetical protein [Candidatus Eremiobacteraeota bacterium]
MSSKVVEKLTPGHPFNLRHLGAVKAKGKTKSVEIYECYDNDSAELKDHKSRTKELFGNGVSDFRKGLFLSAGKTFQRVAALNQFDTVAAHFRDSCTMSVMNRTSEWDGAEKIEVK